MAGNEEHQFPKELLEALNPPPGGLTPAQMVELDLAHGRRVFARDHDAIRETSLVEHPVYESFPQAVRIEGIDAVRARHEVTVMSDASTLDTLEIRTVAFGHNTMVVEWSREHEFPDGTRKRCYAIAVIPFEGDRLTGERVYTDKNLAWLMDQKLGPEYYERPDVTPL